MPIKRTYFKWLKDGREATHRHGFKWPAIGKWLEVEGDLVACKNGLHVMEVQNLWQWYGNGYTLYEVEVKGEHFAHDKEKEVCRKARLKRVIGKPDAKMLRLLACDIAETTLPIFETAYPDDKRPRQALEVARRFVYGNATSAELTAARAAALAAAGDRDAAVATATATATAAWAASRASRASRAAATTAKTRYGQMLLDALNKKPKRKLNPPRKK